MCVCACVCESDCVCVFMRTFVYRHGYDRYYKEKVIYEDIFSVPII